MRVRAIGSRAFLLKPASLMLIETRISIPTVGKERTLNDIKQIKTPFNK